MLKLDLIPTKLLDVCDFVKAEKGCVMYSTYLKPELKNTLLIKVVLEDFEIAENFRIPSKALEVARKLNNAQIEVNESNFIVKNEKNKFTSKLMICDVARYQENEYNCEQIMNVKKMLSACDYVAKLDKKPILKGVYLTNSGNIYASDSFSVYSFRSDSIFDPANAETGISIPTDFIKTVNSLFGTDDITIKFNAQKVAAIKDNITIESILYAGEYPKVENIISGCSRNHEIDIDTNIFNETLEYINYIDYENDKKPLIKIENNKITLFGQNQMSSDIDFDINWLMNIDAERFSTALKTISGNGVSCYTLKKDNVAQMLMLKNHETNEIVIVLGVMIEK